MTFGVTLSDGFTNVNKNSHQFTTYNTQSYDIKDNRKQSTTTKKKPYPINAKGVGMNYLWLRLLCIPLKTLSTKQSKYQDPIPLTDGWQGVVLT